MKPQTWRPKRRPSRFLNGIDFRAFLSVQIALPVMFMGMVTADGHREKSVDLAQVDHVTPLPSIRPVDARGVANFGRL